MSDPTEATMKQIGKLKAVAEKHQLEPTNDLYVGGKSVRESSNYVWSAQAVEEAQRQGPSATSAEKLLLRVPELWVTHVKESRRAARGC